MVSAAEQFPVLLELQTPVQFSFQNTFKTNTNLAKPKCIPRVSSFSKKPPKLALKAGKYIPGIKSYGEDQKQLNEVVMFGVKGQKQHMAAAKFWFTVCVRVA